MATASSHLLLHTLSPRRVHNGLSPSCKFTTSSKPAPPARTVAFTGRRNLLFLLTATTTLKAVELPSTAADIPLFGLRKRLVEVEEVAEEKLKEGIETAEKEVETVEKEIETVEKEIESGGLAQAGAVAVAEFIGVVVATSVVNGILGPEAQKS
ncbi:uncharacterized protein LOC132293151 [Cornus florida]|uniref:uncharacterized protein LOC132293151 n=1 Tax=Cornus florida TaxID=4283 RepID=UPI002896FFC1|nr:uncharacterized protein LOC132293151 [Cornus florida]